MVTAVDYEYRPPPLMADLTEPAPDAPTLVSTFTGAGGACLGYRWAGFRPLVASEFVEAARATYRANFPTTPIDPRDIRDIDGGDLLAEIGLAVGELSLLEGSPPCASFSLSGSREKAWGKEKKYSDTSQRTDDLFYEFARLVADIQPRVFVAENVSGLVRGTAKGYFKKIHEALADCGYRVQARLLNAEWLGVPQRRGRLFIQGVRVDLNGEPAWPSPHPRRISMREALGPDPLPTLDPETGTSIVLTQKVAVAREAQLLRRGEQSQKYFNLIRPDERQPCPTILANGGVHDSGNMASAAVFHPSGTRQFTLGELRALCGFPADFILTGNYRSRWERLGRAVPPPMTEAIGRAIIEAGLV